MTELMVRAKATSTEAHVLIDAGHAPGAASRANYAVFYAARAALRSIDPELDQAKTHATLVRRFSQHVVLKRGADKALGRLLRQGFDVRQDADYDGPSISIERARRAVENADQFIAAIEQIPGRTSPMPPRPPRERLYLFDTTLRDGAQTHGVDFSLETPTGRQP